MTKHEYFINWAAEIAKGAETHGNQRLACIIVIRNKVISVGVNSGKTHPIATRFARDNRGDILTTPHAEVRAIHLASKKLDLDEFRKATLYVARIKRDGPRGDLICGLATPCNGCQKAIEEFKIKKVFYTLDNEGIGNWQIGDEW